MRSRTKTVFPARRRALLLAVLALLGCGRGSLEPDPGLDPSARDGAVGILFVGNSLTYTHDVPGLVHRLAEKDGRSVATASIAFPNYSLEDHWRTGLADRIRQLEPDVVVMQQGPSSLDESREHLVLWAGRIAEVAREVGAEPAMYMVWPDVSRRFAFGAVEASYAAAATAIEGRLLPAGTTWLEVWSRDEALPLYGGDGFHPGYLGALAAAHTIYAGLFDVDPSGLPGLDDAVDEGTLELLRSAVSASLDRWR